jgi:hypothetical protein
MQDHAAWLARRDNQLINSRFQQVEQQARMQTQLAEFKSRYPDVEAPESLLSWAQQNVPKMNPLEAAYRLREFDNIKAKAHEAAKAEVLTKVQEAGKTTPASTSPPAKKVSVDDILKAIDTLGTKGAVAKYGKTKVEDALRKDAENLMRD